MSLSELRWHSHLVYVGVKFYHWITLKSERMCRGCFASAGQMVEAADQNGYIQRLTPLTPR